MHEASITDGLVKILLSEANRHEVCAVKKVTIKVGKLQAVEPQALRFCFEMFVENTIAEGAELVIDHLAAVARCKSCLHEFEVFNFQFKCTCCACKDLELLQGDELFIDSFEV
ncbi:hydrogenase maturation nickel metallochaperone HypA [Photobacterium alginatilyticum]|uniref:hydrogenase maturation nickel metallochaperone HypA n=1 Tax=Photobacterium alginatilyticum TaxID=1775171 RepID=UPI0040675E61